MLLISQAYLTPGRGTGTGEITCHNQLGRKVHTHVPRCLYGPACLLVYTHCDIGDSRDVSDELMNKLEEFTCLIGREPDLALVLTKAKKFSLGT